MVVLSQIRACAYKIRAELRIEKVLIERLLMVSLVAGLLTYFLIDTENNVLASVYIGFSLWLSYGPLITGILHEKCENTDLILSMNGRITAFYYLGYYFIALIKSTVVISIPILALIFRGTSLIVILQVYALYLAASLAMVSFCLCFTSFFQNPEVNHIVALFNQFQSFLFYVGLYSDNFTLQLVLSISPKTPALYGIGTLCFGFKLDTGYDLVTCYWILFFDMVIYYIIFVGMNTCPAARASFLRYLSFRRHSSNPASDATGSPNSHPKNSIILKQLELPLIELKDVRPEDHPTFDSPDLNRVILEVTNLQIGNRAQDNESELSFKLREGDISTLLINDKDVILTFIKLLTGLTLPTQGKVTYNNHCLATEPLFARNCYGLVSSMKMGLGHIKVEEILVIGCYIRGIEKNKAHKRVDELLEEFELVDKKGSTLGSLQQFAYLKVVFALALVHDPKMLILDQPTLNLDIVSQRSIWQIIKRFHERGKSFLILSNNASEAEELSTRIGILDGTRLVCKGPIDYLRKIYSVGYDLNVSANESCSNREWRKQVMECINSVLQKASLAEETGSELKLFLNHEDQNKFSGLFERLEQIDGINFTLHAYNLSQIITKIQMKMVVQRKTTFRHEEKQTVFHQVHTFKKSPKFNFRLQVQAIILRRVWIMGRFYERVFWTCFPLIFLGIQIALFPMTSNIEKIKLFIMFAHCVGAGTHTHTLIAERTRKMRAMLYIMGCRHFTYWIGNLIFDTLVCALVNLLYVLACYLLGMPYIVDSPIFIFFMLCCFSYYLVILCFCWSFTYTNPEIAQRLLGVTLLVVFVPFPFLILNSSLLRDFPFLVIVRYIAYIVAPIQPLYDGIEVASRNENNLNEFPFRSKWLYPLSMIICGTGYFMWLVFWKAPSDHKFFEPEKTSSTPSCTQQLIVPNKDQMAAEKERIANPSNTDQIQVLDLKKIFPGAKVAVKGISFGVRRQEIFGLVGPSRSGKTTVLEMIAGLIPRTGGDLRLFGVDIYEESSDIFKFIGATSQGTSLWNYLSIEEHMKMVGMIRGISPSELAPDTDYLLDILDLKQYLGKPMKNQHISVKRRLSLALALIGAPSILLLDEPVMDLEPSIKMRFVEIIRAYAERRGAAIIFITQNVQEAAKICDRMGILINGEFVWLDTVEAVEANYKNCYTIFLRKKHVSQESFLPKIQTILPTAYKRYSDQTLVEVFRYNNTDTLFSKVFALLQRLKQQNEIEDFTITAAGIEQSYIYVSQFQM